MLERIVPPELLKLEQQPSFLDWLRQQDLDPEDKKALLGYYVDYLGIQLTFDMVKRAGAK